MKHAVLVVAPPRSGTSVVSHVLSKLGVYFGRPERFVDIEKHDWNPIFFELESLNQLNDKVFNFFSKRFVDFNWTPDVSDFTENVTERFIGEISDFIDLEFSDAELIGLKDTRFCYTLPLWDTVLKRLGFNVSYVLVRRSSEAVFASNVAINQYPVEINFRLVALSSLLARYFLDGKTYITVRFEDLMADRWKAVEGICNDLSLDATMIEEATSVVDCNLRHYGTSLQSRYRYFSTAIDGAISSPEEYLKFREIYLAATFTNDLLSERENEVQRLTQEISNRERDVTRILRLVSDRDERIRSLLDDLQSIRIPQAGE